MNHVLLDEKHKRMRVTGPLVELRGALNVLIVDDDMDAIVPIEMSFRKMGCKTSCAVDLEDACNKILANNVDLLILDWQLDYGNGKDVITGCLKMIENTTASLKPIAVITYSGLRKEALSLWENDLFTHIDHWQKPIKYSDIVRKTAHLIQLQRTMPIQSKASKKGLL